MAPTNPFDTPPAPEIPVLEDVVTPGDGNPMPPIPPVPASKSATAPTPASAPVPDRRKPEASAIPKEVLSKMLSERIAALTDRLLHEAAADMQDMLIDMLRERLREEIPALVKAALKENGQQD